MRILLADADVSALAAEAALLAELGFEVLTAGDGHEALRLVRQERPDVLIADMALPGLDGSRLTQAVQAESAPDWLPVILLSATGGESERLAALEAGADNFLTKPISAPILSARLRQFGRLLSMQRRSGERARELCRLRDREVEQHEVARHLMERLVNAEKLNDPALQHWIASNETFGGDLIAAARTPSGVLHVLLADGTGHGLAASLNVLPVISPFYSMTEKGFALEMVVREINRKVRQILPRNRFVATTLVAVNHRERVAQVWNGGNPPPLLVDSQGRASFFAGERHLALGILDDAQFDPRPDVLSLDGVREILCYSDGLPEAEDFMGLPFGVERVLQAVSCLSQGSALERLLDAVHDHLGESPARDDLSCALIACMPEEGGLAGGGSPFPDFSAPAEHPGQASAWRVSLRLGAAEIRRQDVVPLLLNVVGHFQLSRSYDPKLFLLLSELYGNALDHGLLRLDPGLKAGGNGLQRYGQARSLGLESLVAGEIEMILEQVAEGDASVLHISCRDSGPGFGHARIMALPLSHDRDHAPDTGLLSGRGIPMLRRLCTRVEFIGCGNEIRVSYPLPLNC